MWPYETSNKLINNITNYKLRDQNIKDILDAFNNNDNRDKIVSEQIGFFEIIEWEISTTCSNL